MKNILGLDLGTNSIGWALVQFPDDEAARPKLHLGSRIIPMTQDVLDQFGKGITESKAAERTRYRGMRRLNERYLLRRERLFRLFHVLGFLPQHFDKAIGWDKSNNKTYGKFISGEPKLAYVPTEGKPTFLFRTSFEEMLSEFAKAQPTMVAAGKKIPYDWTQYYLRKKALYAPISKYELAWLILRFNQKRGYYQLRGEEQETEGKCKEYAVLTVDHVEETAEKRVGNTIYKITFTNGMVYPRASRTSLLGLVGKDMELIITTDIDENGNPVLDKEGNVKRTFSAPSPDDWNLKKKRTETFINDSRHTVGEYIYDCILQHPETKINGGYVQTIERRYYRDEMRRILEKQAEYIPELRDLSLLDACLTELYASNAKRRTMLREKGMLHLILDDTLYYQRPLKSKKSEISNCPHEHYQTVDATTGEIREYPIKCIAKSNPFYQEFRLWQFVWNIRLYDNTGVNESDVTATYLPDAESRQQLFLFLNDKESVKQDDVLKFLGIGKPKGRNTVYPVRWNYLADKAYPCNETRGLILKYLRKSKLASTFLTDEVLAHLWHILYSVEAKEDAEKGLTTYAEKYGLPESFISTFTAFPPIKKDYGAFSEKCIKRMLPFIREGMQLWQVEEHLYGKKTNTDRWSTPSEMKQFIDAFKVGSLRNPIVEQCILESLRTVKDIWEEYGRVDEIHVEMGREMKNPAEKRRRMTERIQENENTNMRIKTLLAEFKREAMAGVRPNSPMQQDILRIYEEGTLQTLSKDDPDFKDIYRISHLATPSSSEILRYKLWLEQRYRSPYTGQIIPLSRLFTSEYEIEHIIPRSRYFDDSFQNKVICEAEVNRLKTNMLAMPFIQQYGGSRVPTTHGEVTILTLEAYEQFVDDFYRGNKVKGRNLKLEDIPDDFINRQMNDSRYISRVVKALLSSVVRDAADDTTDTSKHVIVTTGVITDRLKKDWGLNDVWNTLVYPRFERMNQLTGTNLFGQWENKDGRRVFQTNMPLELSAGFRKKRIDHRHHAMDALLVACASRSIVNFLNNESAHDSQRREDLKCKLTLKGGLLRKPWSTFTEDAHQALRQVVVSFKNTVRILSSTVNIYEHFEEQGRKVRSKQLGHNLAVRKPLHKETYYGHVNLQVIDTMSIADAIKRPHDIRDREIRAFILSLIEKGCNEKQIKAILKGMDYSLGSKNIKKVEVFRMTDEKEPLVATRKSLDESFDEKKIQTITDSGIRHILSNYLHAMGDDPKMAFSPEGIVRMNENIEKYNNGKAHKPIIKVRITDKMGEKFAVGSTGNKKDKYVVAQAGTNLYFAIYENEAGERSYETIPLNVIIERMKQHLPPVAEFSDAGHLVFSLTPQDLVYVPTDEEQDSMPDISHLDTERIYKFVDSSGTTANFVPHRIASLLYKVAKADAGKYCAKELVQNELGLGSPQSKNQKALDGQMVKAVCWKLEVDRLGRITRIIK